MSNWFARCAADHRAHDRLWGPERALDADGLTRFQHRAEAALREAGYQLGDREVASIRGGPPGDLYVTGLIDAAGVRVYIYQDGVELEAGARSLRLEDWDVSGPDDMIRALLERLTELNAPAA